VHTLRRRPWLAGWLTGRPAAALQRASARNVLAFKTHFPSFPPLGDVQDNDVPLQSLVPPLQHLPDAARGAVLREPLLPVDVEGDRQYFLSVRYGSVLDRAKLAALLSGQLEGQQLRTDEDS